MEAASILLSVMFGFAGIMITFLGYQIKETQSIEFISLPNLPVEIIRDKVSFSRFAGNRAIVMGAVTILVAILYGLVPQFTIIITLLFILIIAAISLEFTLACKRFF
jgi:hypothetical protein